MSRLRQFWFKFEQLPRPTPINLGCGVTAYSREDAMTLLREKIFGESTEPALVEIIDDVPRTALEPKHVAPNVGELQKRGIWFPQGYE